MKAKVILFQLLGVTICSSGAFAQSQFEVAYGDFGYENAYDVIQTADGGYAMAGYINLGPVDMYVVKLGAGGNFQWSKAIGGGNTEVAFSIIQTADGGYAVAGFTRSYGAGLEDMYIVKLSAGGIVQWSRAIGGTNNDRAYSVIQTVDGGYALAGYTISFGAGNYDFYIVKLDAGGTVRWSRTVGGTNNDYAYAIVQLPDGSYAVGGTTQSFGAGNFDVYIVKLDTGGTLLWNRTIGGTGNDNAYWMIQTANGGYALAGNTNSFGTGGDVYIVKLDDSGTLQWARAVGGTALDGGRSAVVQAADGGYVTAAATYSFGAGLTDMYITKLDSAGTLQWSRAVGGTDHDEAASIVRTTDGGFAAAGYTFTFASSIEDMFIVKFDAGGNTCGNFISPSSLSVSGGISGTPTPVVNSPGSIDTTALSDTLSGGTYTPICVIGIQPISNEIPQSYKLYQNYPNPFNPVTKIKFDIPTVETRLIASLRIFDILGREVTTLLNEQLKPGSYEVSWDASNYPSGVYFYRIEAGDFSDTKKMVLVK